MYKTILVTLETTPTDRAIIEHVKRLAKLMNSRVVLLHVATGAAARWHGPNASGEEVEKAQAYLATVQEEFKAAGVAAEPRLAYGEPVGEIVKWARKSGCDLVAMSTHGHQFVADVVLGATASRVQHNISIPVLMLRAK
jgi:nucleotide-binding universal stress UspA family protein